MVKLLITQLITYLSKDGHQYDPDDQCWHSVMSALFIILYLFVGIIIDAILFFVVKLPVAVWNLCIGCYNTCNEK